MKKILIVSDAWKPQVSGVVTAIENTIRLLTERGYEVTLVEPGLFKTLGLFFYPEIKLAILPRRRLKKLIASADPDFVHIMTEGPLGFAAADICAEQGMRFTTSYHTQFQLHFDAWFGSFTDAPMQVLKRFHSKAAATLVPTRMLKEDLERRGFQNLAVCPLGVDTDIFHPVPGADLDMGKPVFAYVGRLSPEKNVEEFLALDLPGTKIAIGDGPSRAQLEKKYGEHVRFMGYQRGADLVRILSGTDVCVFPSRTETFGLVIIESLACGVPVAAHDAQGPGEIITDGVDGRLHEDLRVAALGCLPLSREACRTKALRYSWAASADAFEKSLRTARA